MYKDKIIYSLIATALFGVLIFALNMLFANSGFWDRYTFKTGVNLWFCENANMHNPIRQPINTFTNFIYLVNAYFFIAKGIKDYKQGNPYNLITANPFYSLFLGGISFYTFSCSTLFHASLIEMASDLDFSAVYSISLYPLMYFIHRIWMLSIGVSTHVRHVKSMIFMILFFTIIYLLLTFAIPMHFIHEIVFGFILSTLILGFYLERRDPGKTNRFYLNATGFFIGVAVLFFKLDTAKLLCNPDSFIQPHSIWHLCNGIAVFYLYLYLRSENYKPEYDRYIAHYRRVHLGNE